MGQVVKKVSYSVQGLSQPVSAKITAVRQKDGTHNFEWSISHYYRFKEEAMIYHPSRKTTDSLHSCLALLNQYAKGFDGAEEIVSNSYWS
jgi:hypothetical protein